MRSVLILFYEYKMTLVHSFIITITISKITVIHYSTGTFSFRPLTSLHAFVVEVLKSFIINASKSSLLSIYGCPIIKKIQVEVIF